MGSVVRVWRGPTDPRAAFQVAKTAVLSLVPVGIPFLIFFFWLKLRGHPLHHQSITSALTPRPADNTSLAAALKVLCWLIVRRQTGWLGRWLKLYRIRYEAGPEVSDRYLAQHLRDLAAFVEDLNSIPSLFKI